MLLDVGEGEPRVEVVRVEYDVEAAAGLPEEFAAFLRTGGKPAAAPAA